MADRLINGRYRPLERHAVGGMATLWRALDERTGEVVALKRLHPFLVADPAARARLEREAAALQALDHPAITRPREVILDPDDPALVMEFAPGRPLQERIATDGPLEPEEAVAIAATVADALGVAHRAGIVHRDVKPANILVEDSGAVHLVDFGIASLAEIDEQALTTARTMVGTLRYAAPERLSGAPASASSDIWSLGAVLYEMLTGRVAATGDERAGGLGVGPSEALMDGLPPGLALIVQRAMSADPAGRYADAGAFRDALLAAGGAVDSEARTEVVPLVPVMPAALVGPPADPGPRTRGLWPSPVDRAASIFFGAVAAVALAAVVVLGAMGAARSAAAPPSAVPAEPGLGRAPVTVEAEATPTPDDDHGGGKGRGKDNGKGKGGDD
jgi:serine/threonine-protein kinase